MLFSIDEDNGAQIVGWIMPDHPSATPRVTVFTGGEKRRVVPATVLRPLLREQGLHDTGICGFLIDEHVIENLAKIPDVELYDETTNIRIYRRRPATATADAKLFRLETRLVPQTALNEPLQSLFHMVFTRLERIPEEAVRAAIGIAFSPSIFCTGRIFFRAFEPLLRYQGFKCTILVRDPFEELAEQLLVLRWAVRTPNLAFSVLPETFRPLVDSLSRTNIDAMEDLETWLGTLTSNERRLLVSPLARLLTCRSSDEHLEESAVENALQTLSDMDVVGLSPEIDTYWDTLRAVLELELPELPEVSAFRQVDEMADVVREWPSAQELLSADAEIFTHVSDAFQRVEEMSDEEPMETLPETPSAAE